MFVKPVFDSEGWSFCSMVWTCFLSLKVQFLDTGLDRFQVRLFKGRTEHVGRAAIKLVSAGKGVFPDIPFAGIALSHFHPPPLRRGFLDVVVFAHR